jgi:hypothetical protein
MPKPIIQIHSSVSLLGRTVEAWPYVFISVSVAGLIYLALSTAR